MRAYRKAGGACQRFFGLIDSTVLEIYHLVNIGLFTVAMSFLV